MKTIYLFLALIILVSCSEFDPGNGSYRVKNVAEGTQYSTYHIESLGGMGAIFILDSVGKYHVGDTLVLHPK